MKKTAPLSHRLDPDLKQKLQRMADGDRRSLTNYIEVVLERHVAESGSTARKTRQTTAMEAG